MVFPQLITLTRSPQLTRLASLADHAPPERAVGSPVVSRLHQFAQLVLSCSELLQTLLVGEVGGTQPLQQRHLVGQLAGSIPQPPDGHVQILVVFLLRRGAMGVYRRVSQAASCCPYLILTGAGLGSDLNLANLNVYLGVDDFHVDQKRRQLQVLAVAVF